MKRYKTIILIAAGIFVFDAFVLNQGAVAVFVILLTLFVFLPRALWGLRTSRALYLERRPGPESICLRLWACS